MFTIFDRSKRTLIPVCLVRLVVAILYPTVYEITLVVFSVCKTTITLTKHTNSTILWAFTFQNIYVWLSKLEDFRLVILSVCLCHSFAVCHNFSPHSCVRWWCKWAKISCSLTRTLSHCSPLHDTQRIGLLTFSAVVVTIVYGQGKLLYDFPTILWLMLHFFPFSFIRSFGRLSVCAIFTSRSVSFENSFPLLFAFIRWRKAIYCTFHVRPKHTLSKRIFFQLTLLNGIHIQ